MSHQTSHLEVQRFFPCPCYVEGEYIPINHLTSILLVLLRNSQQIQTLYHSVRKLQMCLRKHARHCSVHAGPQRTSAFSPTKEFVFRPVDGLSVCLSWMWACVSRKNIAIKCQESSLVCQKRSFISLHNAKLNLIIRVSSLLSVFDVSMCLKEKHCHHVSGIKSGLSKRSFLSILLF